MVCVGGGSRWAPCCLLPATQGLLQEIPALQHFLHTPRGRETWPDVVFPACPAPAPMAQHRDNRRSAPGARRERRPAPLSHPRQENTVGKTRARAQQSRMAYDSHRTNLPHRRGTNLPEGNCWFSPSERRVTLQGKAPLPKHISKRCQKPLSQGNLGLPSL